MQDTKHIPKNLIRDERGYALVLVLILLLIGMLIIAPLLAYMATGLKATKVHEELMLRLYAADAGVEDALSKIKNNQVPPAPYSLIVNDKAVLVTIDSIWILEGIEEWKPGTKPHAELVAVGRPIDLTIGQYQVTITCDLTGAYEREGGVKVERIGVWLPAPFDYAGSSSGITTADPVITNIRGGIKLIWENLSPPLHFPNKELTTKSQFFYITPLGKDPPGDFAWVKAQSHDIYLSWDGDFTTNTVTAIATDNSTGKQTKVVAHTFRDTIGEVGIITWETSP